MENKNADVLNTIDHLDHHINDNDDKIDVDWFEEVNISTIHIQNQFLCEVFSYVDVLHEEDPCSTTDTVSSDDETIPISILSDHDILRSSPFAKDFSGQILTKYFELNNELIHNDPKHKGRINLNSTCTLNCIQKKVKRSNVEIPGVIHGGLCYTLPIKVPDLPIDHPRENLFNCSQFIYQSDKKFRKKCDELLLQTLYAIQQQHLTLMDMIDKSSPKFRRLPFILSGTSPHLVSTPTNIYSIVLVRQGGVLFLYLIIYIW